MSIPRLLNVIHEIFRTFISLFICNRRIRVVLRSHEYENTNAKIERVFTEISIRSKTHLVIKPLPQLVVVVSPTIPKVVVPKPIIINNDGTQQLILELKKKRTELEEGCEMLFQELPKQDAIKNRHASPVTLGKQNEQKQKELTAIQVQISEMDHFIQQEMMPISKRVTELQEYVDQNLKQITKQLNSSEIPAGMQKSFDAYATLSINLKKQEECYQQRFVSRDQTKIQQNAQEKEVADLLQIIEKLQRKQTILENCYPQVEVQNASELKVLLKTLETEYGDLEQKCTEERQQLMIVKANVVKMTDYLVKIAELAENFIMHNPKHENQQAKKISQEIVKVEQFQSKQAPSKFEDIPSSLGKLQEANIYITKVLNQLKDNIKNQQSKFENVENALL
jgi:hypothetical protein